LASQIRKRMNFAHRRPLPYIAGLIVIRS